MYSDTLIYFKHVEYSEDKNTVKSLTILLSKVPTSAQNRPFSATVGKWTS